LGPGEFQRNGDYLELRKRLDRSRHRRVNHEWDIASGSAFLLIRTSSAGQLQRQRSDLVQRGTRLQRRRESAGNHESGPHRSAVVLEFHVSTRWRRAQSQSVSLSSSSSTQLNFTTTVSTVLGTAVFATVNQNSGSTPFLPRHRDQLVRSLLLGRERTSTCGDRLEQRGEFAGKRAGDAGCFGECGAHGEPAVARPDYQIGQMQPPNQSVTISSTATAIQFNTSAISSNCGTSLCVSGQRQHFAQRWRERGNHRRYRDYERRQHATVCSGTITVSAVNSTTSVTIPVQ